MAGIGDIEGGLGEEGEGPLLGGRQAVQLGKCGVCCRAGDDGRMQQQVSLPGAVAGVLEQHRHSGHRHQACQQSRAPSSS